MAGVHNFTVVKNDTWQPQFIWKVNDVAIDLTGLAATLTIRKCYGTAVLITSAGTITTPANGTIDFTIQMAVPKEGDYVYDVELYRASPLFRKTLIGGTITVTEEVTESV